MELPGEDWTLRVSAIDEAMSEPTAKVESPKSVSAKLLDRQESLSVAGPTRAADTRLPVQSVIQFLIEHADMASLRGNFPQLSDEELRECLAIAGTRVDEAKPIHRRKSAYQKTLVRTAGLPDADGTVHRGNFFRSLLALLKPGRLLDLGAGKGNFSLTAAGMGWQVTAVDARRMRWPDPARANDPALVALIDSVRWIQEDVRRFPIEPGNYDLICVLGLLHHLELADQLNLLRRCAGTVLLLDTRIAPALVDQEGSYSGMTVREHGETRAERDLIPTAAWGNSLSFRHTEESLLRLLRECGFAQVLALRPPHRRDYTFYLCLPQCETMAG